MREADRDVKQHAIIRDHPQRDMAGKAWRTVSEIDDDIEDRSSTAPDQLSLREGLALEVQAPDGPDMSRQGLIVLDKTRQAGLFKSSLGKCLDEPTTLIRVLLRPNHQWPRYRKRLKHG